MNFPNFPRPWAKEYHFPQIFQDHGQNNTIFRKFSKTMGKTIPFPRPWTKQYHFPQTFQAWRKGVSVFPIFKDHTDSVTSSESGSHQFGVCPICISLIGNIQSKGQWVVKVLLKAQHNDGYCSGTVLVQWLGMGHALLNVLTLYFLLMHTLTNTDHTWVVMVLSKADHNDGYCSSTVLIQWLGSLIISTDYQYKVCDLNIRCLSRAQHGPPLLSSTI